MSNMKKFVVKIIKNFDGNFNDENHEEIENRWDIKRLLEHVNEFYIIWNTIMKKWLIFISC